MSDLISRKALIERIEKRIPHMIPNVLGTHDVTAEGMVDFIKNQPTVEAVLVVHGEWIFNQYYSWECGNCGFNPFKGYIPKEPGFNYCPNCGCDMRTSAE